MPPSREELHQVMELPMDVSAHGHRAVHWLHVGLLDEDLLHVFAEGLELVLGEVLALLHLRDPQIQIHREGLAGAGGGWRRARGWGGEAKGILGRGFEKGRGLG